MPTDTGELVGRLRAALGRQVVDASSRRRAEYSSDASNYRVVPEAVVFPRSADDVLTVVDVCRDLAVPVTVRGGGTSIAGNSVGPGVVLDMGRHLNQVVGIDPAARVATVQPGVVLDQLQRAAGPSRAAVRARSVHALAVHRGRDDRQQLLRRARDGVRDHRGQRRVPGRDRRRGPLPACRDGGRGGPRQRGRHRVRRHGRRQHGAGARQLHRQPADADQPRVRPVPAPGVRLLA